MTNEINLNLYKAILDLQKSSPDISFFLRHVKIEAAKVPTACIGFSESEKKFKLFINENWCQTFDTYNLAAILEHEMLHVILSHCFAYKDSTLNEQDLNICQDAIINDIGFYFKNCKKLNSDLLKGVFFDDVKKKLIDHKIEGSEHITSQTITCLELYGLYRQLKKENKNDKTIDDHNFDLPDNETKKITESPEAQKILDSILKDDKTQKSLKIIGKGSQDLQLAIGALKKADKIKGFKEAVNAFLQSGKSINKVTTFKRPSRRFIGQKGKIKKPNYKIKLCIDTSGSQYNEFCFECINIALSNSLELGYEIDLYAGDTKPTMTPILNVKKHVDFSTIFKGGGGTKLSFFFDEKDSKNTTYVIVTDGYFDESDIPKNISLNKILMLSTAKNRIFNFRTILIKE